MRKNGFYWICYNKIWIVAMWHTGFWHIPLCKLGEVDEELISEIDENQLVRKS